MPITPFGWHDYTTPYITAANLEAMLAAAGAYTDQLAAQKGAANGIATLDGATKLPVAQLPASAATDSSVRRSLGLLRGMQGVVTGLSAPANQGDTNFANTAGVGGSSAATYRKSITFAVNCSQVCLVYTNIKQGDVDGVNTINVKASLEQGATIIPVFFNGQRQATIEPGGIRVSDPIGAHFLTTDVAYVRTWVSGNSAAGDKWQTMAYGMYGGPPNEGNNGTAVSGPGTDVTLATLVNGTNFAWGNAYVYSPWLIVGVPDGYTREHIIGVGDSIMQGYDGSSNGVNWAQNGWLQRAMTSAGIPFVNVGEYGESGSTFAAAAGRIKRMLLASSATTAIVNYGTNDLQGSTDIVVETTLLAIWTALNTLGLRVLQTTITPRTTSTDTFATVGNQTAVSTNFQTYRVSLNTWLRAGAPIQAGAPVAVGTPGALLAGGAGHPLYGVIELADVAESARNSGLWKATGSANGYTYDGVHPNAAMYALMAAAVQTGQLV